MSAADHDNGQAKDLSVPTKVGALACQMASYMKELTTTVISCTPVIGDKADAAGAKKKKAEPASPTNPDAVNAAEPASPTEYDIVFHDSVLFPEGGGQPHDLGHINDDIEVTKVRRMGDTCVVTTKSPMNPGQEARMIVNWARRLDHMQHHTAQHLLTAVMEAELGHPTESWAMSHPSCYIQIPTASVPRDDLQRVEDKCNEAINKATTVNRQVYESRDVVPSSRSRGIPADVNGPIRLIEVDGVDTCTCCGTHVENLAELHFLKILHLEPKGGTCKVHFVTGERAIQQFGDMYNRERELMKELGTNPDNLVAAAARRGTECSAATKSAKKLLAEVATYVAPNVAKDVAASPTDVLFTYHREDADMDFLGVVGEAVKSGAPDRTVVLACGSLKGGPGEGAFLIVGPDSKAVAESTVCPALEGKGGQSKAGFRGKCNLKLWKAMVKSIKQGSPATVKDTV